MKLAVSLGLTVAATLAVLAFSVARCNHRPADFHPPAAKVAVRPVGPMFHGSPCSQDCSGHEAGYRWAAAHEIDDADRCRSNSASFSRGCEIYVEETEGAANARYDHPDLP